MEIRATVLKLMWVEDNSMCGDSKNGSEDFGEGEMTRFCTMKLMEI